MATITQQQLHNYDRCAQFAFDLLVDPEPFGGNPPGAVQAYHGAKAIAEGKTSTWLPAEVRVANCPVRDEVAQVAKLVEERLVLAESRRGRGDLEMLEARGLRPGMAAVTQAQHYIGMINGALHAANDPVRRGEVKPDIAVVRLHAVDAICHLTGLLSELGLLPQEGGAQDPRRIMCEGWWAKASTPTWLDRDAVITDFLERMPRFSSRQSQQEVAQKFGDHIIRFINDPENAVFRGVTVPGALVPRHG